ncbi:MAG: hypothetical protein U9Q05_05635 [Thermodesulfobacteriota bacterium]|nr:hypothetical protein [Thermodesulfobacteriota bacterium]
MIGLNRVTVVSIGIFVIFGTFHHTVCHAESKSEAIKRLRNKSCIEDVNRTTVYLVRLQQLQANIKQLMEKAEITSPQAPFVNQARSTDAAVTNLSDALTSHNRSKLTICERMNPGTGSADGEWPEGYKGLSKSERIGRLKTDYCTDIRQNGEPIRKGILEVKETMKTMLGGTPPDESLNAPIRQLRDLWSQTMPIVDNLYNEQTTANELCTGIEQGISKSELIRKSKQVLENGGQLPYFWYLLKYN